jgi:hypothetical protein
MLIEHRPFYQFSFFLSHGVIGTSMWVSKFSPGFSELNMIPSLISHPNIYLGLGEQPANMQQLTFVTDQKDLVVTFADDRVVVQMQIIPNRKLPSSEEFIDTVTKILNLLNRIVEGKAIRLAFMTTGICEQMLPDKLDEIHRKLFSLPVEFTQNKTIEWNTRHVYRTTENINGNSELLNVILNFSRIQVTHHFEHKPESFDGIEIGFDINTFQGNASQRFSADDANAFLHTAIRIEDTLEVSLQKIIES